jgi:hypothetical protein
MAYAPAAIRACYDAVKRAVPGAQLSGIYANKASYHNSRAANQQRWPGNYSIQRADDKLGDPDAASALDITLGPADMKKLTQRLLDATNRRDQRIMVLRSWFGTVNGSTVIGRDVRDNRAVTSDASHLWHIHLSGYRRYANDHAAWAGVAAILTNQGAGTGDWFDMATEAQLRAIVREELVKVWQQGLTETLTGNKGTAAAGQRVANTDNRTVRMLDMVTAIKKKLGA